MIFIKLYYLTHDIGSIGFMACQLINNSMQFDSYEIFIYKI